MENDIVLMLGDVEFTRFEVPETINFGGEQDLKIHKLVGGRRVIDSMGASPAPIEWSGWLTGESAVDRAMQLDDMRKAGKKIQLSWDKFVFDGVIRSLHINYQSFYRMPYKISFEVVEDLTALADALFGEPSLDDLIDEDILAGAEIAESINDFSLNNLMSELFNIIDTVDSFIGMAQSQITSVLNAVNNIRYRCRELINLADGIIEGVPSLDSLADNWVGVPATQVLNNQLGSVLTVPQLLTLSALMGRTVSNLANISMGTKTVTVGNSNMFKIASEQYGNAMGWTAIAQANHRLDPFINDIVSLVIPRFDNNTFGVFNGGY